MAKDGHRPKRMKSNAGTDKVKTTCEHCINGDHHRCTSTSTRGMVKCLCANFYHKLYEE
jgi:hypothetical protein